MNKYTFEDIPQILNSISWQLKRIADSLENVPEDNSDDEKPPSEARVRIRTLLKNLNPD